MGVRSKAGRKKSVGKVSLLSAVLWCVTSRDSRHAGDSLFWLAPLPKGAYIIKACKDAGKSWLFCQNRASDKGDRPCLTATSALAHYANLHGPCHFLHATSFFSSFCPNSHGIFSPISYFVPMNSVPNTKMDQGTRRLAGGEEEETVLPLAPGLRRAPNPYLARAMATSPGFSGRGQQQKTLTTMLVRAMTRYIVPILFRVNLSSLLTKRFTATTGFPETQGGLAMSSATGLDNSNHNYLRGTGVVTSAAVGSPPPWLQKDDREVLRYYAYFQEPVYEGGDVNAKAFRVRYFTIYYFTSSGMYM